MIVLLDTNVVGVITNPNANEENTQCVDWLDKLLSKGVRVVTSDLCDYEIRRGLLLAQKTSSGGSGIHLLDGYRKIFEFLPVTATALAEAAELWASARFNGNPNAPEKNIDVDIILCGQWKVLKREQPGRHIIIATDNVGDFQPYAEVDKWQNIYF